MLTRGRRFLRVDAAPLLWQPESAPALEHRPSHRELLVPISDMAPLWPGTVDAIVVPTVRDVGQLAFAADLSLTTGWPLLVLCSRQARALDAVTLLGDRHPGLRAVALDVRPGTASRWTRLSTSGHPASNADGYADVGTKRNVALLVARLAGWQRVLFLDDDMLGLDAHYFRRGAGVLRDGGPGIDAVGWVAEHYPDNSVVCHVNRFSGGEQDTFPGSGALAVRTGQRVPLAFFPPVYNEDWLFLFDWIARGAVALAGQIGQAIYDPFARVDRAAAEEFGDVLGEGLFELLHAGADLRLAHNPDYWELVIDARHRLLDRIERRLTDGQLPDGDPGWVMRKSIQASRRELATIGGASLADFVARWRSDVREWHRRLQALPVAGSVDAALDWLELDRLSA